MTPLFTFTVSPTRTPPRDKTRVSDGCSNSQAGSSREFSHSAGSSRADGGAVVVLQAALLIGRVIHTMPRPARHGDLMHWVRFRGTPDEQGFLLSDGSYATRERAWEVAQAAGQTILRHPEVQCGPYLFSEDLW